MPSGRMGSKPTQIGVWFFMKSQKEAFRSTVRPLYNGDGVSPDRAPGTGKVAERLRRIPLYGSSRRVMVTLDRSLVQVRLNVLTDRKKLFMPTRALKDGFLTVDPQTSIPPRRRLLAVQPHLGNAFAERVPYDLDLEPPVDLIVTDALAVGRDGTRLGDGRGHLDLQFAILRELGWLDSCVQVVALVRQDQVHDSVPAESHDIGVHWIVTPDAAFPTSPSQYTCPGIMWEALTVRQIKRNGALFYLHARERSSAPGKNQTFY